MRLFALAAIPFAFSGIANAAAVAATLVAKDVDATTTSTAQAATSTCATPNLYDPFKLYFNETNARHFLTVDPSTQTIVHAASEAAAVSFFTVNKNSVPYGSIPQLAYTYENTTYFAFADPNPTKAEIIFDPNPKASNGGRVWSAWSPNECFIFTINAENKYQEFTTSCNGTWYLTQFSRDGCHNHRWEPLQ